MDNREGAHALATWARRPQLCALTVTVLGLASLVISLQLPVGLAAIAFATIGAVSLVAGALTLAILLFARVTGMHRRADEVVLEGRDKLPFASRRVSASAQAAAPAEPAVAPDEPSNAVASVLDITEPIDVRAPART